MIEKHIRIRRTPFFWGGGLFLNFHLKKDGQKQHENKKKKQTDIPLTPLKKVYTFKVVLRDLHPTSGGVLRPLGKVNRPILTRWFSGCKSVLRALKGTPKPLETINPWEKMNQGIQKHLKNIKCIYQGTFKKT